MPIVLSIKFTFVLLCILGLFLIIHWLNLTKNLPRTALEKAFEGLSVIPQAISPTHEKQPIGSCEHRNLEEIVHDTV